MSETKTRTKTQRLRATEELPIVEEFRTPETETEEDRELVLRGLLALMQAGRAVEEQRA